MLPNEVVSPAVLQDGFEGAIGGLVSCCGTMGGYIINIGYNEHTLIDTSRDYTTFQTPYGALHLVTVQLGES